MIWFFVLLLSLFGFLFLGKGIELWAMLDNVEANGISLYFLGVKVIDYVAKDSISSFALGFIVAALIPFLLAVTIAIKTTYASKIR